MHIRAGHLRYNNVRVHEKTIITTKKQEEKKQNKKGIISTSCVCVYHSYNVKQVQSNMALDI